MALSMKRKATGLKKPSKGFVYHERSVDSVKRRAARTGARFDSIFKPGFDTWRPKQGDNLIRFLPPTWDDHEHYAYTIYAHRNIGADKSAYLCPQKMLGKPCPICAASKEARDGGEADEAKALQWAEQGVSWILDRDADGALKPVLFQMSWTFDRDVSSLCLDNRKGNILLIDHPDNGYDLSFQRTGAGLNTRYFGFQVDRQSSAIDEDEDKQQEVLDFITENPIPDVLNFFSVDKLESILSGAVAEKDEELDEDSNTEEESDNEDKEARSAKKARRRQEEDDDQEDDDAPQPKKAKRQVVEEEVEEDDAEDDPPPRKAKRQVVEEEDGAEEDDPSPKKAKRQVVEEDDDDDDDDVPLARLRSSRNKREEVEEDGEEDGEEDDAPPRRRVAGRR